MWVESCCSAKEAGKQRYNGSAEESDPGQAQGPQLSPGWTWKPQSRVAVGLPPEVILKVLRPQYCECIMYSKVHWLLKGNSISAGDLCSVWMSGAALRLGKGCGRVTFPESGRGEVRLGELVGNAMPGGAWDPPPHTGIQGGA